eukprot:989448-Pelagomonas_calceolata.AAC.2
MPAHKAAVQYGHQLNTYPCSIGGFADNIPLFRWRLYGQHTPVALEAFQTTQHPWQGSKRAEH